MAIASGLPVPEIYVLDSEAGINAFAAGLDHSNAAIAVTRGALEQLDRAELQGVIAHELGRDAGGDAARFAELKTLRDPARLERALARLTELPARSKRGVLTRLLALIRHDRELRTRELELFRVVGATLGCPLPPSGPRPRVT